MGVALGAPPYLLAMHGYLALFAGLSDSRYSGTPPGCRQHLIHFPWSTSKTYCHQTWISRNTAPMRRQSFRLTRGPSGQGFVVVSLEHPIQAMDKQPKPCHRVEYIREAFEVADFHELFPFCLEFAGTSVGGPSVAWWGCAGKPMGARQHSETPHSAENAKLTRRSRCHSKCIVRQ